MGHPLKTRGSIARRVLIALFALVVAFLIWHSAQRKPAPPPSQAHEEPLPTRLAPQSLSSDEAERQAEHVAETYRREVSRPRPVADVTHSHEAPTPTPDKPDHGLPEEFHMVSQAKAVPDPVPAAAALPSPTGDACCAPFGRLIKCVLVGSLDGATQRTEPIMALVCESLCWNGRVIIAAGTEAFGYAKSEAVVDASGAGRLVDTGDWKLILAADGRAPGGRELTLRARALTRSERLRDDQGRPVSWNPADGTDGLAGYTVDTSDGREQRLFAAAALEGAVRAAAPILQTTQPSAGLAGVLGVTQASATLGNAAVGAAGSGTQAVLSELAARLRDELQRHGSYVRVPAGTPFYLFVEQAIDPTKALAADAVQGGRP